MYDYDITQYTCHDGNIAKILIPNNVTEDDLRGLYELLQVVAVRRFGLDLTERSEQMQWIPCRERLPSKSETYLATYEWTGRSGTKYTEVGLLDFQNGRWNCLVSETIIAWMPLPKPFTADTPQSVENNGDIIIRSNLEPFRVADTPQTEKPKIRKRIDKPFRAVWLDDDHNEIGTPQTERSE